MFIWSRNLSVMTYILLCLYREEICRSRHTYYCVYRCLFREEICRLRHTYYCVNTLLVFIAADGICRGKICTSNARCDNFTCVCMTGYTGNGYHKCDGNIIYM